MAKNIGPVIGIDGEKEYRNQINAIINQAKVLDSEMRMVSTAFDNNTDAQTKAKNISSVLTKQIELQKERVKMLTDMTAKSAEKFGETDKKTQSWQIALNDAKTALYKMEDQLDNANNALDDTSDKTEKSQKRIEKLGDALKVAGAAFAAMAAASAAAAVSLAKNVVESFGELEQNLGGSEAVFGDYAESIQKTAEDAYKNMGTSQSDYLATANKIGALLQGSGLEQKRSLTLTEQAMQRAADMASVMGIDTADALEAITGAAKGNYTMMDNLGVAMNATTLAAYATSKGIKTAFNEMSNADKAELAMRYFFEQTEQYAGNFARESEQTISGSIGMLKSSVSSFVAGLGNDAADMENLTQNVIDSFLSVVNNVVPVINNLIASLPQIIDTILPEIENILPQLLITATNLFESVLTGIVEMLPELVPVAIDAIMMIANTLIDPENISMIMNAAVNIILTLVNGLIEQLPTLVPAIIDALLTIVDTLTDPENLLMLVDAALKLILALAEGLVKAIPKLIAKIPDIITNLVQSIIGAAGMLIPAGMELIMTIIQGITNKVSAIVQKGKDIVDSVKDGFMEKVNQAKTWGKDLIKNFIDGITAKWNALKESITNIANTIKSFLGFSEPEKGPLSNFHTYAPDMMKLFAKGIQANTHLVTDQIKKSFNFENIITASTPQQAARNYNYGGFSIVVNAADGQDANAIANTVMQRIQQEVYRKGAVFA